ncbi:hypothetical protein [Achromobacter ruhlandii]|uniref:hypothetical protein n=1 Tax=Achromobacter ruhlandii TaxID=72557 RepID=UPI0020A6029F|nr:hypothetical protein [Achromobacter ruhlandii]
MNSRNGVPQCNWMCEPEISAMALTNSSGTSPKDNSSARAASSRTAAAAGETAGARRWRRVNSQSDARKAQAGKARFSS